MEKVTIYFKSGFGNINKVEAKLLECGYRKYAQYDNAAFVTFIPKGKRKPKSIVTTYNPFLVVVKGWNHPNPMSMFDYFEQNVGFSRHNSFDPAWVEEFKRDFKFTEDQKIMYVVNE